MGHLPNYFYMGLSSVQGSFWNSSVSAACQNMWSETIRGGQQGI